MLIYIVEYHITFIGTESKNITNSETKMSKTDTQDYYIRNEDQILAPLHGHQTRRDFHHIMIQILEFAKKGIRKTELMYNVHLTHPQIQRYLEALQGTGFIRENSKVWKTTKKGMETIKVYMPCYPLIEEARRAYFGNSGGKGRDRPSSPSSVS